jgi:hypothetical protein
LKPEVRRVKKIPKNHMRKVLTGIEGSSIVDTAACTSGYGDSLFYIRRENREMNRIEAHSSGLIVPLLSSPVYLLVDSSSTTGITDGGQVRSKFGSFKCSMMKLTSFWTLCAWKSWTCWGEEVLDFKFASSIMGG